MSSADEVIDNLDAPKPLVKAQRSLGCEDQRVEIVGHEDSIPKIGEPSNMCPGPKNIPLSIEASISIAYGASASTKVPSCPSIVRSASNAILKNVQYAPFVGRALVPVIDRSIMTGRTLEHMEHMYNIGTMQVHFVCLLLKKNLPYLFDLLSYLHLSCLFCFS